MIELIYLAVGVVFAVQGVTYLRLRFRDKFGF